MLVLGCLFFGHVLHGGGSRKEDPDKIIRKNKEEGWRFWRGGGTCLE